MLLYIEWFDIFRKGIDSEIHWTIIISIPAENNLAYAVCCIAVRKFSLNN